jgi:LacI family transcriptional regulator
MIKQVSVIKGTGHGVVHQRAPGHPYGVRPTMKDVASRARVALKTVSRVVNGEPGVTAATASRVLGAIEDLGFRRNESARLLRTGHTATLGFIADSWTEQDHAAVYRGLEEVARSHGYLLYSGSTDSDPVREERLALDMCARRVISPTTGSHDYLVPEIEAGVATVFVLRPPAMAGADADSVLADTVLPDERGGGRAAVAHLIAQGHRRIGVLAVRQRAARQQLLAGYAEAMKAAGLTVDPAWTTLDADGLDADLNRASVTAVLCADRPSTEAALRALAGSRRLAVVGFGDFEIADLVSPGITVLSYDPTLIGRTAGELLVRRLAGDEVPPRQVEVPVRLIARGSAEFPPPR